MTDRRTALYRLFDLADQLLYVGIAYNPADRWLAHESNAWWPDVARDSIEWHPSRELAAAAEVAAIQTELPLHNRAHTGRSLHEGVSLGDARSSWADVINSAAAHGRITYLTSRGRRIAAVVPLPIAERAEAERKGPAEPDGP